MGAPVWILRCETGVESPGTLAKKVIVPTESLVPIPAGWSLEEMAGAGDELDHLVLIPSLIGLTHGYWFSGLAFHPSIQNRQQDQRQECR